MCYCEKNVLYSCGNIHATVRVVQLRVYFLCIMYKYIYAFFNYRSITITFTINPSVTKCNNYYDPILEIRFDVKF